MRVETRVLKSFSVWQAR